MRYGTLVLLTLCWAGLASGARADITYEYVTDQTTYTAANPGDTVTVTLYLQETATKGSQSLIAAEGGLSGAGVAVAQSKVSPSGASATTISAINPNNSAEPDGFTGNGKSGATAANAFLSEFVSNGFTGSTGPSGTTKGGSVTTTGSTTVTDVLLGTLTLKAGDTGSTTTFTVLSLKNSSGNSFSGHDGNTLTFTNFNDLDPNSAKNFSPAYTGADSFVGSTAYTFQVTVAATPEPGSLVLGAVAASSLALGAWRCRRNRLAAKA
jgi:hypothetical protein